jgi:uncharacterized protein YcgI (DUF1989 family)
MEVIEPRCGTSFILNKGDRVKVTDLKGEQVSDFFCFMKDQTDEYLSSGRTLDYMETIFLTKGHTLYSNLSRPMAKIVEDEVGRHDFLLTPCSKDTFRIIYGDKDPHHGCEGNLLRAFAKQGIELDSLPNTFNLFMNVDVSPQGRIKVLPPTSKAGQSILIEALEDLVVGLTACSALQSNNGSFKPIGYSILR